MKISKLILELGVGYIIVNSLNKRDLQKIDNKIHEKMDEINPSISNVFNQINYLYEIEGKTSFKTKEIQNKIKEVQKQIDEIDSAEISKYILNLTKK